MDRVARNLDDLRRLVQTLTKGDTNRIRQGMPKLYRRRLANGEPAVVGMGTFAELERALIGERQREFIIQVA